MNSLSSERNRLLAEEIAQTLDHIVRWLQQSAIPNYFNHHPSIRRSFLEAVQQVAGRRSLVPVAPLAANYLDNKPVVSDCRKIANPSGSIPSNDATNEWVEQTSRDVQSYANSSHLDAGTLNIESSSHNNPAQVDTIPQAQAERKRKRKCLANGVSIDQGQLASVTATLSTLPRDFLDKWNRIAGTEAIFQLWQSLWVKRGSLSNKERESTLDPDTSIEGQLRTYQLQYQKGIKGTKEYKQFAEVPWRLYLASISSLYLRERAARKNVKEPRKRNRGRNRDAPRKSVFEIFIDFLLPELLKEDTDTREEAKRRFDNWIQHGKRWAKLIERFGSGILLLIPQDLVNDNLRNMKLLEVDALIEHLDSYRPSLKADIQNLTSLLPLLIEDQYLPDQRLQLEMFTKSQIASGEHATQSLKVLFKFSDDCSAFLTEAACSNLSQPIPETATDPLMGVREEVGGGTALPGPLTLIQNDSDLTYTNTLYLLSPVDTQGMDQLCNEFSFEQYLNRI